ncbi:hypothetical protein BT93_A1868 [Corymbia citriodora subsp. variegata]|nr:hypothetical protein BT93_A1868 [Corymbia citriodora subsp. variegata]
MNVDSRSTLTLYPFFSPSPNSEASKANKIAQSSHDSNPNNPKSHVTLSFSSTINIHFLKVTKDAHKRAPFLVNCLLEKTMDCASSNSKKLGGGSRRRRRKLALACWSLLFLLLLHSSETTSSSAHDARGHGRPKGSESGSVNTVSQTTTKKKGVESQVGGLAREGDGDRIYRAQERRVHTGPNPLHNR